MAVKFTLNGVSHAPAVANAVRDASGLRLHTLPFDLAAARRAHA